MEEENEEYIEINEEDIVDLMVELSELFADAYEAVVQESVDKTNNNENN